MATELNSGNRYYCALCGDYHETFRFLRDQPNSAAELTPYPYVLTDPGSVARASSETGSLEFRAASKLTSDF